MTEWVRAKPGGWKKKRNEREVLTIARMLLSREASKAIHQLPFGVGEVRLHDRSLALLEREAVADRRLEVFERLLSQFINEL